MENLTSLWWLFSTVVKMSPFFYVDKIVKPSNWILWKKLKCLASNGPYSLHYKRWKVILLEVILIKVLELPEIASIFDPHKALKAQQNCGVDRSQKSNLEWMMTSLENNLMDFNFTIYLHDRNQPGRNDWKCVDCKIWPNVWETINHHATHHHNLQCILKL